MAIDLRDVAVVFVSACVASCGTSNAIPPLETGSGYTDSGADTSSGSSSGSSSGGSSGSSSGCGSSSSGAGATWKAADTEDAGGTSDAGSAGDAGDAGSAGDAGDAGDAAIYVATGTVSDVQGDALSGVSVCIFTSPCTCVLSDAGGDFSLAGIPPSGSGIIETESGLLPGIFPMTLTSTTSSWSTFLRTQALMTNFAGQIGATAGGNTGIIHLIVNDATNASLAGVTVTTSPPGKIGYINTTGAADPTLSATSTQGYGFVFEEPPGQVEVTFAAPGLTCTREGPNGWPPTTAGATMTVPVVAGEITRAGANCH